MKKQILAAIAFIAMAISASAQTDILASSTFENTYAGINFGVNAPLGSDNHFMDNAGFVAGFELGKGITPVVGLSLDFLGTFGSTSFASLSQTNLVANIKLNLNNWFGGYKGEPRPFEVSLVPAIGLGRDRKTTELDGTYFTLNPHAQFDFNLGKSKAAQLNLKPGFVFRSKDGNDGFAAARGAFQILAGFTYKFASRNTGSHNFVKNPYSFTKEEYDRALARIAEFEHERRTPKIVVKEVPVETIVEVEKQLPYDNGAIITFGIGSSELQEEDYAKIKAFASQYGENALLVIGSADTGTGTEEVNARLAEERALVVAKSLKDLGVKDVKTSVQFDSGKNVNIARSAVMTVAE